MKMRSLSLLCLLVSGCVVPPLCSDPQPVCGNGGSVTQVSLTERMPLLSGNRDAAPPASDDPRAEQGWSEDPGALQGPEGTSSPFDPGVAKAAWELAPPDLLDSWSSPDAPDTVMETDLRPGQTPCRNLLDDVISDHVRYYSADNLFALAAGVGVAAAMANTGADESFRDFYQENVRDVNTDEYFEAFHAPEVLGDGMIMIPVCAGAAVAGYLLDDRPLGRETGDWGRRCLRTILVGGPPMLAMQAVTGASRPGEAQNGSQWTPFQDNNGASGHSFVGAVPFLSAAKMTDNRFWKAAFYVGSTLPGLSRINDDRHYASQVVLGWWMAYLAATAVDGTRWDGSSLAVFPTPIGDGIGVGVEYRR